MSDFLTVVYVLAFSTFLVIAMRAHKRTDPTRRPEPPRSAVWWALVYTSAAVSSGVTLLAHVLRQVIA